MPLFHATIFTVYQCGFFPVCALMEDDGSDNRLDKIIRCIEQCRYSIHDISRTELSNGFPRFNMPFELGIFFGAKRFGQKEQKMKTALILEKEKFTYQKYISDLSGMDTKAHNNDVETVIRNIRDWLHTASGRKTIPQYPFIQHQYVVFLNKLQITIQKAGLDKGDLTFNDYCQIVEEFIREQIQKS